MGQKVNPVSYTHLDVYKRQHQGHVVWRCGLRGEAQGGGGRFLPLHPR